MRATKGRALDAVVDQLLTTAQAAALLNTPPGTLRWWRHQGTGPKAFRLGARKVMYRRSDLDAWLDGQYAAASDPA
ncbi:helix-turn-helix transcriptional regulator [Actinoplanes sp. CA-051413]|uniref:helix-turn-helix transcriptional regulator n=1 Tax=Actinoplanes sp. CA-051413 TaxID=3239899 RepID=UPI003D98D5DD